MQDSNIIGEGDNYISMKPFRVQSKKILTFRKGGERGIYFYLYIPKGNKKVDPNFPFEKSK